MSGDEAHKWAKLSHIFFFHSLISKIHAILSIYALCQKLKYKEEEEEENHIQILMW